VTRRDFPFGLPPEAADPALDERGFDTVNRLLLHGARYHDRRAVFASREDGEMPDWRADRYSIRIALALAEDHGVGPGDVVAVAMPLSVRFALAERAIWALGAVTFVGAIGSVSRSVKAAIALDSDWTSLLDRGGALDTPERASWLRAVARSTPPDATASIEPHGSLRQRDWVDEIESFLARCPPERGCRSVSPSISARREIYAGWADGLTTVVLTLPT
jgi:acyl-coenzyme A synthetase/AMP-(fatty) acid ligase